MGSGQLLYEFRRGYARCVSIYSLSFSADSLFLCASSNTETVHIFKLEDPKDKYDLSRHVVCQTDDLFPCPDSEAAK